MQVWTCSRTDSHVADTRRDLARNSKQLVTTPSNTQPFSRLPSLLDERVSSQFPDITSLKPETVVAKLTKCVATRKGCDMILAPSGRFLTQEFDVTDCETRPPLLREPYESMLVDCPTDAATPTARIVLQNTRSRFHFLATRD